jgi:hypothetical protein
MVTGILHWQQIKNNVMCKLEREEEGLCKFVKKQHILLELDLPNTIGTTRQAPHLVRLSVSTSVPQQLVSILVLCLIDIHAIARRGVDNVTRGIGGPLLRGLPSLALVKNNVEELVGGGDGLGVEAVGVGLVILVKCELDGAFFEFPNLVPGGATCVKGNGVVLCLEARKRRVRVCDIYIFG